MLTPQDVSSRSFAKAMMGGYNMAMVDEFLDELTDDYTALYKENAALKAKMKILVDKVEEYRETEDSMRAALLAAQKMASSMVEEAETKKRAVLAGAETEARRKISSLQDEVEQEEQRLVKARAESALFLSRMRTVFEREMQSLEALTAGATPEKPEEPTRTGEPGTDVSEIEAKIMAGFSAEDGEKEPEKSEEHEQSELRTRILNLKELKFGRNYQREE